MTGLAPSGRMRFIAVAVVLCAGYFCSTAFAHPRGEWTKLILTQHWPETFCSVMYFLCLALLYCCCAIYCSFSGYQMEQCKTNLSYWTLHGLWPNTGVRCNTSWHFNASLIKDILPEMEKVWPDLLVPSSPEFWKYEWQKHGTCAAKAESMNSEHKYFSKALELYHKFDLNSVLRNNNIVPSEERYTLDDVETALINFYNVKPKIQCVHPGKGGQFQTLGQIEICVDRDFQLINCEKSTEEIWSNDILASGKSELSVCDHSMPIYYPPVPSRS